MVRRAGPRRRPASRRGKESHRRATTALEVPEPVNAAIFRRYATHLDLACQLGPGLRAVVGRKVTVIPWFDLRPQRAFSFAY